MFCCMFASVLTIAQIINCSAGMRAFVGGGDDFGTIVTLLVRMIVFLLTGLLLKAFGVANRLGGATTPARGCLRFAR